MQHDSEDFGLVALFDCDEDLVAELVRGFLVEGVLLNDLCECDLHGLHFLDDEKNRFFECEL